MLKQVLNYNFSTIQNDTSKLTEVKSKAYKHMYYIFNDGRLLTTIGLDTISKDNHKIAHAMYYNLPPKKVEVEMWQEDKKVIRELGGK